jgi:hypothetical protein
MIPKTISEATKIILDIPEIKQDLLLLNEDNFVGKYHSSLGLWIRNTWKFWANEGELYNYFILKGLTHPDDMSGVILRVAHREFHNIPLNIDNQIQYYIDYWKRLD